MSTRKVKDAKDLETDELIYFKGHAKVTYMSDGRNVEDAINSIDTGGGDLSDYITRDELSDVATSGNYDDLSNKPTIPSAVTESTVSGWGFTKNTGTYSKPSTGIPKTDLASAVQTSLGKADTALQSEQYKGTVTSVKINGTTKTPDTNGMVDLGTIEGGGGSSSGSGAYPVYDYSDEIPGGSEPTDFLIEPNVYYILPDIHNGIYITFGDKIPNIVNEFVFQWKQLDKPITLPDTVSFVNGFPSLENGKTYQCSIVNNIGLVVGVYPNVVLEIYDNTDGHVHYATIVLPYGSTGQDLLNNYNDFHIDTSGVIAIIDSGLQPLNPEIYPDDVLVSGNYSFIISSNAEPASI